MKVILHDLSFYYKVKILKKFVEAYYFMNNLYILLLISKNHIFKGLFEDIVENKDEIVLSVVY